MPELTPQRSQQWKEEIETKTNAVFEVHIHHGKDKLKTLDDMESKDVRRASEVLCLSYMLSQVIITTYQTLNNDFAIPKGTDPEDEDGWLEEHG